MQGCSIESLSQAICLALRKDGVAMSPPAVSRLWKEAAAACDIDLPDGSDFIDPLQMFVLFADFSGLLGRFLGRKVELEGFALDWADPYPHLVDTCRDITVSVVRHMSSLSEVFERDHGYSPGEVFMKSMCESLSPEVAAASLERDRQRPVVH